MTSDPVTLKSDKKEAWRAIRRELTHPLILATIVVALTVPFWVSPFLYFFLWTFTFASTGLVPWFVVTTLSLIAAWAMISNLILAGKFSKEIRPYRLVAIGGDHEARMAYIELRKLRPSFRRFWVAFLCIHLIVPCLVSIVIMNGENGGHMAIRDHGKLRKSTRDEDIRMDLRALQARGIFKPLSK
jgi:hypothetical protein